MKRSNTNSPAGSPAPRHTARCALVAAVATAALTLGLTAPASATAYRYWSYWQGASGEWVMSSTGPGDHQLVDQDVQGWRFGISTDAPSDTPDNAASFAALCPDLAATAAPKDGSVRVAVVVDAGSRAAAPSGEKPPADQITCTTLAKGATGNQALAAAGTVRAESSMVCAINSYPTQGCGDQVSDKAAAAAASAAATEAPNPATPATSATAQTATKGSPWALIASLAAVFAVALAAFTMNRRRASVPAAQRTGDENPSL